MRVINAVGTRDRGNSQGGRRKKVPAPSLVSLDEARKNALLSSSRRLEMATSYGNATYGSRGVRAKRGRGVGCSLRGSKKKRFQVGNPN